MQTESLVRALLSEVGQERRRLDAREEQLHSLAAELGISVESESEETSAQSSKRQRPRDVVIVPANSAYRFYHQYDAYVCQANRAFRSGLAHLGFYTRGAIQPEFPRIMLRIQDVEWTEENAERLRTSGDPTDELMASLIETTIRLRDREPGARHDVFLLSAPDDPKTFVLPHVIAHDTRGRGSAWTQRQRYVSLASLKEFPKTTDELDAADRS